MPKMTHWNSPDPIEASTEKAAVYRAQGWVNAPAKGAEPKVTAMTTETASEQLPAKPAKKAVKKSPAKKAAKKS